MFYNPDRPGVGVSKKGFTLIEILIVVAIITVLASFVLIGLGPTQRAGRDARRIADLRQVQTGLELYFSKCGYYPGNTQANSPCAARSGNPADWTALSDALKGSGLGITNVPNDPKAGANYSYGSTDGSGYVLAATLEDANNSALAGDADGTLQGVSCDDPVYCLTL